MFLVLTQCNAQECGSHFKKRESSDKQQKDWVSTTQHSKVKEMQQMIDKVPQKNMTLTRKNSVENSWVHEFLLFLQMAVCFPMDGKMKIAMCGVSG